VKKVPKRVRLDNDQEMAHLVASVQADKTPRLIERDGIGIAVLMAAEDYERLDDTKRPDIWEGYDPEKALAALRSLKGLLRGVDRDLILGELRESRGQDSTGRPA